MERLAAAAVGPEGLDRVARAAKAQGYSDEEVVKWRAQWDEWHAWHAQYATAGDQGRTRDGASTSLQHEFREARMARFGAAPPER